MQRILLIEDDRDINESNQTALELEGYEVRTTLSMHAGVNLCETFHPDLVLLDIILPDANALDWGRRLKEDYGVNILYLSGLNTKEDMIRGLRAGGDDYMTKPYLIEELLLRVSSLMRRRDQPPMREDFSTGKLIWHVAAKQIELNGEELQLQPKEYAVLEYLQRSSARYVSSQELAEKIWVDMELPFKYVSESFVNELQLLQPFGLGNERPLFARRNVLIRKLFVLGKNQNVLKLLLEDEEGSQLEAVLFGPAEQIQEKAEWLQPKMTGEEKVSVFYHPDINVFRNQKIPQARIVDIC